MMYSFSCRLFKHAARQKQLKLMCKNFHCQTALVLTKNIKFKEAPSEDPEFLTDTNRVVNDFDLTNTIKVLNKYSGKEVIKWEKVTRELTDLKVNNLSKSILLACWRLEQLNLGLSYYNHLTKAREELDATELLFLCKLLKKCKDFSKYEALIEDFYRKIKNYMFSSTLIKTYVLGVFVRIPSCFWDIVENIRKHKQKGNQAVVHRAFDIDKPDVGWEFTQDEDFDNSPEFVKSYIGYCTRKARDGKFSVDLINDLINCYNKKSWCFPFQLNSELNLLVEATEQYKNDYVLKVEKCAVDSVNECSHCLSKLRDINLSEDEIRLLKRDFSEIILNTKFINIHSSKEEMRKFYFFLKNCKPYNFVIDGLNLLYQEKTSMERTYTGNLKKFLDRKYKILIIARNHSRNLLLSPEFLKESKYNQNVQFFFTSNLSDDDRFTLYAALHGGPNTYFCTGDFFQDYGAKLPFETRIIYNKWKVSHQFLAKRSTVLPPWTHMGLPQLTVTPQTKHEPYIWHLPYGTEENRPSKTLTRLSEISWLCLKAIPREKPGKGNTKPATRKRKF